jgi:uncharacterized OB-fold protein
MILREIDGMGEVLSHTVLQMPPEGFDPPLRMALVKLEEDAVILCLSGNDGTELRIGDRVRIDEDSNHRFRYYLLS